MSGLRERMAEAARRAEKAREILRGAPGASEPARVAAFTGTGPGPGVLPPGFGPAGLRGGRGAGRPLEAGVFREGRGGRSGSRSGPGSGCARAWEPPFEVRLEGDWSLIPRNAVFLCLGTDRSTGDAFGPLVGSALLGMGFEAVGHLADPAHALNFAEKAEEARQKALRKGARLVVVDGVMGWSHEVGRIEVRAGGVRPRRGELPEVGEVAVLGTVQVGGLLGAAVDRLVLGSAKLANVAAMAKAAALAIGEAAGRVPALSSGRKGAELAEWA